MRSTTSDVSEPRRQWASRATACGIDNIFNRRYKQSPHEQRWQGPYLQRFFAGAAWMVNMTIAAFGRKLAVAALAAIAPLGSAVAQETAEAAAPNLLVELNALQPTGNGCRFTFMVTNSLGGELVSAAFELVLFDKGGMVSRMTIVDFKDMPDGKTKVRQFDFSGVDCAQLGRVLVNDATECKGEGIDPRACIRSLRTESRTDAVLGT